MSTTNKKAYVYKMNLLPANLLSIFIFLLLVILTFYLMGSMDYDFNSFWFFPLLIGYMFLHEFLHGVGYFLGGCKRKNIQYGVCLEKGIFYCMAYQEITRKNILISLQMPFVVIGVITYIIGLLFHLPLIALLSILNIMGASMDLVMFFYLLRLPSNVTYSESGEPDEFIIVSNEDLRKRKSFFLRVVDVRDYHKRDFEFHSVSKFQISKWSIVILGLFFGLGILLSIFS